MTLTKRLTISKYRTFGNDYIIVDNRDGRFDGYNDDASFKKALCHRIFGIGGTGICELKCHQKLPFEMVYHLGTGQRGTACGTGSMCLIAYARDCGLLEDGKTFQFKSYEGLRAACITGHEVKLSMTSEAKIISYDSNKMNYFVDVKHYIHVKFIKDDIDEYDVVKEGREITMGEKYKRYFPTPTLMLVQVLENGNFKVRAYDPTSDPTAEFFACGTGSTAAGIAYAKKLGLLGRHQFTFHWRDGKMKVSLTRDADDHFKDVELYGNTMHLFDATAKTENFLNKSTRKNNA